MALVQGQVGATSGSAIQPSNAGANPNIRQGYDSGLVIYDGHARYQEAVQRGSVFVAASQAGVALTNLVAATTGLILTNPIGSGKNLVIWEIGFAQTSAAAAAANATVSLAAQVVSGTVTQTTPLTVRNALIGGGAAAVGLAATSVTLAAAPVLIAQITQPSVSATATTAIPPMTIYPVDGKFVVAPGYAVALNAASALSGLAHIVWEEVPTTA